MFGVIDRLSGLLNILSSINNFDTDIKFLVSVPVLSEQILFAPPIV